MSKRQKRKLRAPKRTPRFLREAADGIGGPVSTAEIPDSDEASALEAKVQRRYEATWPNGKVAFGVENVVNGGLPGQGKKS